MFKVIIIKHEKGKRQRQVGSVDMPSGVDQMLLVGKIFNVLTRLAIRLQNEIK